MKATSSSLFSLYLLEKKRSLFGDLVTIRKTMTTHKSVAYDFTKAQKFKLPPANAI